MDFVEAQALWLDPDRVEVPARSPGEERFMVIGRIEARRWSAVIAYRGRRVRLISVRRARPGEVMLYGR
jgi:uncharacterized DUF497 family protein